MVDDRRYIAALHVTLQSLYEWPAVQSMLDAATRRSAMAGDSTRWLGATLLEGRGLLLCCFAAASADRVQALLDAASLPAAWIAMTTELPRLDHPEGHD